MRIGFGYDVHGFEEGDSLTLGGVVIPFDKGIKAHSDGDVLIHSVIDAILGAASMGDIGLLFPDTDPKYAGADSRMLLREVGKLIEPDYEIGNLDVTVIAERPRIKDFREQMVLQIASDLGTRPENINIKGTTSEKIGFVGREEGIAVASVCLLRSGVRL